MLRFIALNVVDELSARFQILGASLGLDHGRERRVIDMAGVQGGISGIGTIQPTIGLPSGAEWTANHPFVLSLQCRSHVCAVLLNLELSLDADVLEVT